jgi:hypothetical protein
MLDFLLWLEATALSTWLREALTPFAFPTVLTLHTVGMGFLVGTNTAIDLRILGVASQMPLRPMERFFTVMWFGFGLNAVSGVLLLIAYPTKAVTNPLFYVKLTVIGLAVANLRLLRKHVFRNPGLDIEPMTRKGRILAGVSLVLWAAVIAAGRFLAYTYTYLRASDMLTPQ